MNKKLLVDRFLAWPLPESLCSDPCASIPGYPHRAGTNLMTAEQAEAMIEYVIAAPRQPEGEVEGLEVVDCKVVPVELLERAAYLLELGDMDGPAARELRSILEAKDE